MTSKTEGNVDTAATVGGYRDLIVWQKAVALVVQVYRLTRPFPVEERYGLVAQLRRAAVSIPSNIAEGQARHTTREFIHFISNAEGSAAEVDTQMVIAVELGFCSSKEAGNAFDLLREVSRMLNGLRRRLEERL